MLMLSLLVWGCKTARNMATLTPKSLLTATDKCCVMSSKCDRRRVNDRRDRSDKMQRLPPLCSTCRASNGGLSCVET